MLRLSLWLSLLPFPVMGELFFGTYHFDSGVQMKTITGSPNRYELRRQLLREVSEHVIKNLSSVSGYENINSSRITVVGNPDLECDMRLGNREVTYQIFGSFHLLYPQPIADIDKPVSQIYLELWEGKKKLWEVATSNITVTPGIASSFHSLIEERSLRLGRDKLQLSYRVWTRIETESEKPIRLSLASGQRALELSGYSFRRTWKNCWGLLDLLFSLG